MDFTAGQLVMVNGTGEAVGSQNDSPVPQINNTHSFGLDFLFLRGKGT